MPAVPMGATSNAGSASIGSKVHKAAVLVGQVKNVVDAARWVYPYARGAAMLARPLLGI